MARWQRVGARDGSRAGDAGACAGTGGRRGRQARVTLVIVQALAASARSGSQKVALQALLQRLTWLHLALH